MAGKASEAADASCAHCRHDGDDVRAVRPSEVACGSRNGATSGGGDDACACAAMTVAVAEAVCVGADSRVAVAPETVGDGGLVAEARSSCRLMLLRVAMGMTDRLGLVTTSDAGLRLVIGVCSLAFFNIIYFLYIIILLWRHLCSVYKEYKTLYISLYMYLYDQCVFYLV